jgi:hypothetical protein
MHCIEYNAACVLSSAALKAQRGGFVVDFQHRQRPRPVSFQLSAALSIAEPHSQLILGTLSGRLDTTSFINNNCLRGWIGSADVI